MQILKRRSEFRAAAKGKRIARRGFVLQARRRRVPDAPPRFGFTVTRKTGIAVARNRIRRRLKAAVAQAESHAQKATDYVLVGRRDALTLSFARLVDDLKSGLDESARGPAAANRAR